MATRQKRSAAKVAEDITEANTEAVANSGDGFGVEYRELARQRRFIRDSERTSRDAGTSDDEAPSLLDDEAAARRALATAAAVARSTGHRRAHVDTSLAPDVSITSTDERLTDHAPGMLTEMARMADRLVQARESLGAALNRAERAETDLSGMNARMMAARALVHEAQQEMHLANERAAWLEGRCETLHESLEVAVNASLVQRWMWRKRLLKQRTAPGLTD